MQALGPAEATVRRSWRAEEGHVLRFKGEKWRWVQEFIERKENKYLFRLSMVVELKVAVELIFL